MRRSSGRGIDNNADCPPWPALRKLVWFDEAAHLVTEEEPGKTQVTLVHDVLPQTADAR